MIKKGNQSSTEAYLRAVGLPLKTKSYTPITHGDIIDKLASELSNANFVVENVEYTHTYSGKVAGGKVYIRSSKDEDMGMMFSWMNSYNKMVKFSCGVGAFIYENNTSFFGTEGLSWIRMHTGTANAEAFTIIEQIVDHAHYHFDKIITEKERMKANPITIETYSSIMGSLYFEHELLKPTQVTAIDREYKSIKSPVTDKDNLWGLYKVLMFGIDGADIKIWQQSQQKLHHMIMTEYDIAVEDPMPLAPNELRETGPPTQEEMKEVIRQCSSCGEPTVNKYYENADCEVNQRDEAKEVLDDRQEWADKVLAEDNSKDDHVGPPEMYQGNGETISNEEFVEVAHHLEVDAQISKEDCCIEGTHMTSVDDDGFCNNCGEQEECTTTELEDIHEEFLQAEEQEVNEHVGPPEMYEGVEEEVISEDEIDFTAIANKYSAEELVEPVEIIAPTFDNTTVDDQEKLEVNAHQDALDKAAEEGSEEFMLPKDKEENFLDIPEHESLNISEDSLEFTNAIEKEMAILYGSVRPYKVTKTPTQTNVIIDETEECFYISVT